MISCGTAVKEDGNIRSECEERWRHTDCEDGNSVTDWWRQI